MARAAGSLYLDTSAVLRATLEAGLTPEIGARIHAAEALITSRLSLVESARAFHRLRSRSEISERSLADAEREVEAIWARCEVWDLNAAVCEAARHLAPGGRLRTLDALHLATFFQARRRIAGLQLLNSDERLLEAAGLG